VSLAANHHGGTSSLNSHGSHLVTERMRWSCDSLVGMRRNLRIPTALVVLGFLGVVAGAVGELKVAPSWSSLVSWFTVTAISFPVGYGLIGLAWWHLVSNDVVPPRTARYCSRLFALAALAFAASWSESIDSSIEIRLNWRGAFYFPHWRLLLASEVSSAIGLLVAAVGLWLASNARPMATEAPDETPVDVGSPIGD
jgi:hypothetical protein